MTGVGYEDGVASKRKVGSAAKWALLRCVQGKRQMCGGGAGSRQWGVLPEAEHGQQSAQVRDDQLQAQDSVAAWHGTAAMQ